MADRSNRWGGGLRSRTPSRRGAWSRLGSVAAGCIVIAGLLSISHLDAQEFLRGDSNSDGRVSGSDAHHTLSFLFVGKEPPQCMQAADTNGDGSVNISDPIGLLNFLVLGGQPPCMPFPEPGRGDPNGPECGEVTLHPPVDDPESRLRVANAIAGPDGRAVLNVFATNAVDIAGYFLTIRLDGARFGAATQVTDLSETLAGGFAAAAAFDGRIRVGFLSSILPQTFIPPGDDQPVFQIEVCLESGLEPGDYQLVIEDAELVDFETGRAILPSTEADVLAVPRSLASTGCVSPPEPDVEPKECRGGGGPPDPPDPPDPPGPPDGLTLDFARGDVNLDERVSMSDTMAIRRFLFIGGALPPCLDAADANDDGRIDITDMIFILNHVFLGGPPPPAPFPDRGPDPTVDGLGCDSDKVVPPAPQRNDVVSLGEVSAVAGQTVGVPVVLTNRAAIEGFQLVIRADPPVFRPTEIDLDVPGGFFRGGVESSFHAVRALPDGSGTFVVGFIPDLVQDVSVPPGDEQLLFSIRGELAINVEPGTEVELAFVDDVAPASGDGSPLSSELVSRGETRLPDLVPGRILVAAGFAILRGDTNHDGDVNLTDSVSLLNHLFAGGAAPTCADEADANDDGRLNITDAIAMLNTLFRGGALIPEPFPEAGVDPTVDDLPDCGAGG